MCPHDLPARAAVSATRSAGHDRGSTDRILCACATGCIQCRLLRRAAGVFLPLLESNPDWDESQSRGRARGGRTGAGLV